MSSTQVSELRIEPFYLEEHSLDEVTRILHEAYAPLAAMGFNYVAATQTSDTTRKRLMSGQASILRLNGQMVGTVTYYPQAPSDSLHPLRQNSHRLRSASCEPISPRQWLGRPAARLG